MPGNLIIQLIGDDFQNQRIYEVVASGLHLPLGKPYYLARVAVTQEGRESLGALILLPGMPAEVLFKTGERTLFEYLIKPARNAFARSLIED